MNNQFPYSSNDVLDAIQLWDKTVEIIVFVDTMSPRRKVGDSEFLKFYVNNSSGKNVQCVIWGKNVIEKFEALISANMILHIDGCFARATSKPEYNRGNVPYELQILETTNISSLGRHIPANEDLHNILNVDFIDVIHWEDKGLIKVGGFIKMSFVKYKPQGLSDNFSYGCGSITNGTHKLEVRIAAYDGALQLPKGQPVLITGKILSEGGRLYLKVQTEDYIEVLEEELLPLCQILNGTRDLKRVAEEELERVNRNQQIPVHMQ